MNKFFCAIIVLISLTGCKENEDRFATYPIKVNVGGNLFVLPNNYTSTKKQLIIKLLLPTFEARTRDNEKYLEDPNFEKALDIGISREQDNSLKPSSIYFSENDTFNKTVLKNALIFSKYKAPVQLKSGLIFYQPVVYGQNNEDMYLYTKNGINQLVVKCTSPHNQSNLLKLCVGEKKIFGNLSLYYRYPEKYVPDAIKIDTEIENLLTKFRQGSN